RHPVLPDQRQDRRLDRREFRIEREDDALLALNLLLAVRIGEDDEDGPVRAGRRLDDVRNIAMVRVCWIDVLETLPRVLLVPPQIEVRPVVDPLELVPAEREFVLDVEGALRVVRELLRRVLVEAQPLPADAERDDPLHAASLPVLEPLLVRARLDEELHLRLLELAGPEDEVARRDLVAERLADLRDPERHALAGRRQDVLEVDEDPLRRLRPEVDGGRRLLDRAHERLEHEIEHPRLAERVLRAADRALPLLDLGVVRPEPTVAVPALDERVREARNVPAR